MSLFICFRLSGLILFISLASGCQLSMKEVKRELAPHIEKNQLLIQELREDHQMQIERGRKDISALELAVSTLRDKIQSTHDQVVRNLTYHNERLVQLDQMQLKLLEQKRTFLQHQLQSTVDMIRDLEKKLASAVEENLLKESDPTPFTDTEK